VTLEDGRWKARCTIGGKPTFLGAFGSEEEAARACDRMTLWSCKAGGKEKEEVLLNFPLSEYSDDEVTALQGCTLEKMLKKLRSSEYTGVSLEKRTSRWLAQSLVSTAKRVYLGTFGSEVEAARTWDRMQLWLCKADGKKEEEVQLNFPLSEYSTAEVTALQRCAQEEMIEKLRRAGKAVVQRPATLGPVTVKRKAADAVPGVQAAPEEQSPRKKSKEATEVETEEEIDARGPTSVDDVGSNDEAEVEALTQTSSDVERGEEKDNARELQPQMEKAALEKLRTEAAKELRKAAEAAEGERNKAAAEADKSLRESTQRAEAAEAEARRLSEEVEAARGREEEARASLRGKEEELTEAAASAASAAEAVEAKTSGSAAALHSAASEAEARAVSAEAEVGRLRDRMHADASGAEARVSSFESEAETLRREAEAAAFAAASAAFVAEETISTLETEAERLRSDKEAAVSAAEEQITILEADAARLRSEGEVASSDAS
jgi:DNA repair exonuclease SbcCD ATPase subunit